MADTNNEGSPKAAGFCPGKAGHYDSLGFSVLASAILFLGFCFGPSAASSAPFCVEAQGIPAQCWYYDVSICRKEAVRQNGFCAPNLEEISLSEYGAPFCIIDSGMVPVCAYQNSDSCNAEAAQRNAVCFANSEPADQDPYRFDRALYREN